MFCRLIDTSMCRDNHGFDMWLDFLKLFFTIFFLILIFLFIDSFIDLFYIFFLLFLFTGTKCCQSGNGSFDRVIMTSYRTTYFICQTQKSLLNVQIWTFPW